MKVILLTAVLLIPVIAAAQTYPDPIIDSSLKYGISRIILQDYREAEKTFTTLDKAYPFIPLGKTYLAAVKIARSYDYGEEYNEAVIDSLLELAVEQSHLLIDSEKKSLEQIFPQSFRGLPCLL